MKASKIVLMGLLVAVLGAGCEYYTSESSDGTKVLPIAGGTETKVRPEAKPEAEGDARDEGEDRPTEVAEPETPETDRAVSDTPRIGPEAPQRLEDLEAVPFTPPTARDVLSGRLPEDIGSVVMPLNPPSAGEILNVQFPEDIRAGAAEAIIPASSNVGAVSQIIAPTETAAVLPYTPTANTSASKTVHVFTRSAHRPFYQDRQGRYLLHWQGEMGSDGRLQNLTHHRILSVDHSSSNPDENSFDEAPTAVKNSSGLHVFSRKGTDLLYWQCDPSKFGPEANNYECQYRKSNFVRGVRTADIRGCVVSTKDEFGRLHVFTKGNVRNVPDGAENALLYWSGFGGDDLRFQGAVMSIGAEPESCPGAVYSPAKKKLYVFSRGKRPDNTIVGGGSLNVYSADVDENGTRVWDIQNHYGIYTVPGGENACGAELGYDSEGRMSPVYNAATGKIHLLHTEYAGRNGVIEWTGLEDGYEQTRQRLLTEDAWNRAVKQYPVGFVDAHGKLRAFAKSGAWNYLGTETYWLRAMTAGGSAANLFRDHPSFPKSLPHTDEIVLRDAPAAMEDSNGNFLLFFRGASDKLAYAAVTPQIGADGKETYKTIHWTFTDTTDTDGCPAIVAP